MSDRTRFIGTLAFALAIACGFSAQKTSRFVGEQIEAAERIPPVAVGPLTFFMFPTPPPAPPVGAGSNVENPNASPPDFVTYTTAQALAVVTDPFVRPTAAYFTGVTRDVTSDATLLTAISNSQDRDTIRLTSAFSSSSRTDFGAQPGLTGWVRVITSDNASLPTGRPTVPNDYASTPKHSHASGVGCWLVANAGGGWWFDGIYMETTNAVANSFIRVSNAPANDAQLADRVLITRCLLVTPNPELGTTQNRNGISLNGKNVIVEHNCMVGAAQAGNQTYGFSGWSGYGRFLINENNIEASGTLALWGGSPVERGTTGSEVYNHDIVVRRNYYFRRAAWFSGTMATSHVNFMEIKNAQRTLWEANVCHGFNGSTQKNAINIKSEANVALETPVTGCADAVFRYNILDVGEGPSSSDTHFFKVAATSTAHMGENVGRIYVAENFCRGANWENATVADISLGSALLSGSRVFPDIHVKRNTYFGQRQCIELIGPNPDNIDTLPGFVMKDNVKYGTTAQFNVVRGDGAIPEGQAGLDESCGAGLNEFSYNTIAIGASGLTLQGLPGTNTLIAGSVTVDADGNVTSGNGGVASHGGSRGVQVANLLIATAGVEITDHAAAGLPARSV